MGHGSSLQTPGGKIKQEMKKPVPGRMPGHGFFWLDYSEMTSTCFPLKATPNLKMVLTPLVVMSVSYWRAWICCSAARDRCETPEEREKLQREMFFADTFITGANALSLDGQMVNIDGVGNRVGLIVYGPKYIIVVAGMNKVCPTLEDAVKRARTVAAPRNQRRLGLPKPCACTGVCADCLTETSICNQILIIRNCKPAGRIKFILVGEELGF